MEDASRIQGDLTRIQTWALRNGMRLNAQKSVVISYSRNLNVLHIKYKINDVDLKRVDVVKD